MAHAPETAELPPLLETIVRPWVAAIETASPGMREMVSAAASNSSGALKRRIATVPALDIAIAEAVVASVAFAAALEARNGQVADPRTAALGALATVVENLRTAEPSESTRALGLGW